MRKYSDFIDIFHFYKENKQIQFFNREQLLNLQRQRFCQIVKHALTISPFYRDLYGNAGISLKNVDDIHPKDCPLTNKKMLMDNFDRIVSDSDLKHAQLSQFINQTPDFRELYQNKYYIIHTSGSVGYCGLFPFSKKEFTLIKTYYLDCIQPIKPFEVLKQVFKRKKLIYFGATHGHFAGVTLVSSIPSLLYDHRYYSVLKPIEDLIDELNKLQPEILTGYASSIFQLAEAQIGGLLKIKPEKILCSGDPMHSTTRSIIQKAFGINPFNLYSCTEAPTLAWQINDGSESMYVGDHMYHLDLVQDKACLSNLYLYSFPIIRYQMEDSFEFQEINTSKPFTKIKLKNVRTLDVIEITNNQGQKVQISPMALVSLNVEGLLQYQFCKRPNNTILVKVKGEGEDLSKRIKIAVLNMLQEARADKAVNIEIEKVDYIPVDQKTGKFKLVNAT
jgi:phenylacetate-CoA ligase